MDRGELSLSLIHIGACRAACVGTRVRLGYAAFDAQLQLYAIYTYVCTCVSTLTVDFASLRMSVCVKRKRGVLTLSVFTPRYL